MNWLPLPEVVKKRAIQSLLHHYLGHFLQEKLSLDQLSIDLGAGKGSIHNVLVDVFAVNELLQKSAVPIEILDGFVHCITVAVPWTSLKQDNCLVEVEGLQITLQPNYDFKGCLSSMTDSLYNSFRNMTTSIQLAQETYQKEKLLEEAAQKKLYEGQDVLAQTIEQVVSKIKVDLKDTTIRIEHVDEQMGIALEVHIDHIKYFDELDDANHVNPGEEHSSDNEKKRGFSGFTMVSKCFIASGITITLDQFSRETYQRPSLGRTSLESAVDRDPEAVLHHASKILQFSGEQVVKLRMEQQKPVMGAKIDVQLSFEGCYLFLTPNQVFLLSHLLKGFANANGSNKRHDEPSPPPENLVSMFQFGGKSMTKADYDVIEKALLTENPGVAQESVAGDDLFFSLSPCTSISTRQKTISLRGSEFRNAETNFDMDSFSGVTDFTSRDSLRQVAQMRDTAIGGPISKLMGGKHASENADLAFSPGLRRIAPASGSGQQPQANDVPNNFVSTVHCELAWNCLVMTLLHVDPLFVESHSAPDEADPSSERDSDSQSLSSLKDLADKHFRLLNKNFDSRPAAKVLKDRNFLSDTCSKHDHLRLVAGPVRVDFVQKSTKGPAYTDIDTSVSNLELLECVCQMPHKKTTAGSCSKSDRPKWTHVELLCLCKAPNELSSPSPVILKASLCKDSRSSKTSVNIKLPECKSEVDISIVDRLAVLRKLLQSPSEAQTFSRPVPAAYTSYHLNQSGKEAIFQRVFQDTFKSELDVTISASHLEVDFRFPIPDLRPEIEKNPWFARSLRQERLHLILSNCSFNTKTAGGMDFEGTNSSQKQELSFEMKRMQILFADVEDQPAKLFLEVGPDMTEASPSLASNMDAARIHITLNDDKSSSSLDGRAAPRDMSETLSPEGLQAALSELDQSILDPGWGKSENQTRSSTPFSSRKLVYDNENIVMPGNATELETFMHDAMVTSQTAIEIILPVVVLHLPSKDFFENLYNRIGNDLLLWQPSAPYQTTNSMEKSTVYQYPKLDLASQFPAHSFQTPETEQNSFFMFQSTTDTDNGLYDSDLSDDDSTNFFSVKNRANVPQSSRSLISVSVSLGKATLSVCCDADEDSAKRSHFLLALNDGNFFIVSQYHGNESLDYACLRVKCFSLYSKCSSSAKPTFADILDDNLTSRMHLIIERSLKDDLCTRSSDGNSMLTLAIKMLNESERSTKRYLISSLVCDGTLHHYFVPPGETWLEQLIAFLDVTDVAIAGYDPPQVVTEMHIHLQDCSLYYRPKFLSPTLHSLLTFQSFSISSNVITGAPKSLLRMIIDNAAFHISDRPSVDTANTEDFIKVIDVGFLEIRVSLSNEKPGTSDDKKKPRTNPEVDLTVKNNGVHLHTCADSCAAIARLLKYLSLDGDFSDPSQSVVTDDGVTDAPPETLSDSSDSEYEDTVSDLLMDAMQDIAIDSQPAVDDDEDRDDDGGRFGDAKVGLVESARSEPSPTDDSDSGDDFCIIDDPDVESHIVDAKPEVQYSRTSKEIQIVENHFCTVLEKADQLRAPINFPTPVFKYTIQELTCTWSMYGGNDFGELDGAPVRSSPKVSPLRHRREPGTRDGRLGGSGRDTSKLVETQLSKIRFRHEVYDPRDHMAARTVLIVSDLEIRDRLHSSDINKLLYCFHSESSPKQSHANMLLVKALQTKPEGPSEGPECRLRVSLQPLRLNIDQDTLDFVTTFFGTLASLSNDNMAVTSRPPHVSPHRDAPRMSRAGLEKRRGSAESDHSQTSTAKDEPPEEIFFREFVFTPEVPIRLDYHGKHIDIEQGTLAGLLMGLGQLNCSQLKLRKIAHRHGLLGIERVITFALNEWADDIRRNQLPSILGGVGPLHSVVQFFQGVHDLVWLPVEQYRKDGRIIRGIQKGTSAFGTSTTMATLELTNRLVCLVQSAAETAYDVVSPADRTKRTARDWRALEMHAKRKRQPVDLREGVNNALNVVRDGVSDTAASIARAAHEEHEQKGMTGAVGGVLRHIPSTLVRPVIIATEATSNILSGVRNQILPDAKREEDHKYRTSRIT